MILRPKKIKDKKQFVMVILKDVDAIGLPLDDGDTDTIAFFATSMYKARKHADWLVEEINKEANMVEIGQVCKLISIAEIKSQ